MNTLKFKKKIEVYQQIANLPWLQVGQQGTITSVRKDVLCVTLDAPQAPPQVTTVMTAAATLLGIYTGPFPVPTPPPLPHGKIRLSVEQQSAVRGICEMRMRRVPEIAEIASCATSTHYVVHAMPADAPAHRGGTLSNSCTQFPLETVIQLLKEAGVDLQADVSSIVSGKPPEAVAPDADNQVLVNMPATCDFEGGKTSWRQGRPPGKVGPQLSELELSASYSSVETILGVCLYGFNGDTWMSKAEGAHDDIQVGEAAGVNDPGDIPWRMTGWRAGAEDVLSVKVAKRVGVLPDKIVTVDRQGAALGGHAD